MESMLLEPKTLDEVVKFLQDFFNENENKKKEIVFINLPVLFCNSLITKNYENLLPAGKSLTISISKQDNKLYSVTFKLIDVSAKEKLKKEGIRF